MPPKTIPFAAKLRLWPETAADIEARLKRHLVKLRKARHEAWQASVEEPAAEPPPADKDDLSDELPLEPSVQRPRGVLIKVTYHDEERIRRRARALVRAREAVSGATHVRKEDLERLRGVMGGVELRGPASEHEADEIAARLLEEMPWHARALEVLWRDMRQGARAGQGLRFRPILLDGSPGVGKTHLALRLAELARVPHAYVDVATSSDGFTLAGAQRTWGSANPGRPVSLILETRVGNPIVFVDEAEKGGTHHSYKGGTPTSAHLSLLSLLEPASARVWSCPILRSRVSDGPDQLGARVQRRPPAARASGLTAADRARARAHPGRDAGLCRPGDRTVRSGRRGGRDGGRAHRPLPRRR